MTSGAIIFLLTPMRHKRKDIICNEYRKPTIQIALRDVAQKEAPEIMLF